MKDAGFNMASKQCDKKKCDQFTPSALVKIVTKSYLGYNLLCVTQWEYSIPQNSIQDLDQFIIGVKTSCVTDRE